jgi:hypothetical protein
MRTSGNALCFPAERATKGSRARSGTNSNAGNRVGSNASHRQMVSVQCFIMHKKVRIFQQTIQTKRGKKNEETQK